MWQGHEVDPARLHCVRDQMRTKCPECEALDSFVSDEPEDHLYCRACGYEMVAGVSVLVDDQAARATSLNGAEQ